MATQLKEVRLRIASVKNTLQITKAMKMASANKLKKAQAVAAVFQPYFQHAQRMITQLGTEYPQLLSSLGKTRPAATPKPTASKLIVLISSDKGLCGGYNTNICKRVYQDSNPEQHQILSIGKKAGEYFSRRNFKVIQDFQELYHNPHNSQLPKLIQQLTHSYLTGKYSEILLAYTHFLNPALQSPQLQPFLPLKLAHTDSPNLKDAIDYEDGAERCVEPLLRTYLSSKLYAAILDAQIAEHSARVNAMEQATENANKISEQLKISYNRARQSLITTEMIEIISGAASI